MVVARRSSSSGNTGNSVVDYGRKINRQVFGDKHWNALYILWMKESGWNPRATNRSSGAYGIPQSLPASKMASYGDIHSYKTQIKWGCDYIRLRYGSPSAALSFHFGHNWY